MTDKLELQPEEVRMFWRFMQERYRTTVVDKNNSIEMKLVARGLDALGIVNKDRFLKSFTTTIGRCIYTPFEVGSSKGGWDLWHQIVTCVHEHQHVVQHDREGFKYEVSYVIDRAARARWEAEAYRSNIELEFWRYGTTPSAQHLASLLRDYGCRDDDIEVAAKSLALSAVSVEKGALINEATRVALGWLNERLPRLRKKPS